VRETFVLCSLGEFFRLVTLAALGAARALVRVAHDCPHCLVARLGANVVEGEGLTFKDPYVRRLPVAAPAGVVRVERRLLWALFPQVVVRLRAGAGARAQAQRRVHPRSLGQRQPGQALPPSWHLALREAVAVVEELRGACARGPTRGAVAPHCSGATSGCGPRTLRWHWPQVRSLIR
jgi:hypothetical protein